MLVPEMTKTANWSDVPCPKWWMLAWSSPRLSSAFRNRVWDRSRSYLSIAIQVLNQRSSILIVEEHSRSAGHFCILTSASSRHHRVKSLMSLCALSSCRCSLSSSVYLRRPTVGCDTYFFLLERYPTVRTGRLCSPTYRYVMYAVIVQTVSTLSNQPTDPISTVPYGR